MGGAFSETARTRGGIGGGGVGNRRAGGITRVLGDVGNFVVGDEDIGRDLGEALLIGVATETGREPEENWADDRAE